MFRLSRIESVLMGMGLVVALSLVSTDDGYSQQVLQIERGSGRDVINDELRSMWAAAHIVNIDHERGILYVKDHEEPNGIMAFSLETGERITTFIVGIGGGPHELPRRIDDMIPSSEGGMYLRGGPKILELDAFGQVTGYWQPRVPPFRTICEWDGEPAVLVQGGIVRRSSDGKNEFIGTSSMDEEQLFASDIDDAIAAVNRLATSEIMCDSGRALTVLTNDEAPDSIAMYSRDGRRQALPSPSDFLDERPEWPRQLKPKPDGNGNFVLISNDDFIAGKILDPTTGCYAIVQDPIRSPARELMGIYADSALMLYRHGEPQMHRGQEIMVYFGGAYRAALHPLHRLEGEPCSGMLPSIDAPSRGDGAGDQS